MTISRRLLPVVILLGVVARSASGQGERADHSGRYYLAASAGASVFSDVHISDPDNSILSSYPFRDDHNVHVGYSGGAALGYHVSDHWRFELEARHFASELAGFDYFGGFGEFSGEFDATALMLNGFFDAPVRDRAGVYLGGGVGATWIDAEFMNDSGGFAVDYHGDDVVASYQLLAGVAVDLTDDLALTAGYRFQGFFETPDIDRSEFEITGVHSIELGLRFRF